MNAAVDHFAADLRETLAEAPIRFPFIASLDADVKRELLAGMACAFAIGAIGVVVNEQHGDLDPIDEIRPVLAGLALVHAELVASITGSNRSGHRLVISDGRPDRERAAELAAAHRAIADMFDAGAVNLLPRSRMMFIRSTDLGPERTAAVKAAMRDTDVDVARPATPQDMVSPWVVHRFGQVGGMEVVVVEGLDDPSADAADAGR